MKRILGSLLLLSISLFAKSTYEWQVHMDKQELYVHEATKIRMQCVFSVEGKNDDVEFKPPQDLPFEFELLGEDRSFIDGRQHIVYEYLVFARKAGEYQIKLAPQILFTTQSAIDNIIIGRDNVNDLEVEKETAIIPPLAVNVHPSDANLTGMFTFSFQVDKTEVFAYEPVHVEFRVEATGNLQDMPALAFDIKDVEVFSDIPEVHKQRMEKGYRGEWVQRFAFVGHEDFTIPAMQLKYFDPGRQKTVVLKSDTYAIKIKKEGLKREELIDEIDSPSSAIDWKQYTDYMFYLLSFMLGFMIAKLVKLPQLRLSSKSKDAISSANSEKALLNLLLQMDKVKYAQEISALEEAVYEAQPISLSQIKKQIKAKA
jgi:hypothetical protein